MTSLSSWSPWFWTSTVIVGGPSPSETVFSASAVSGVLSIVVLSSAEPVGALGSRPASLAKALSIVRQLQVVEPAVDRLGQEDAVRDLGRDALLVEHRLDLVAGRGRRARRWRGSAAHVAGDPVDRLVAALVAERGRDVLGDPGERVAAQLERLLELGLRVGQLVGRVEALDPLQQALGRAAVGRDLRLERRASRRPPAGSRAARRSSVGELVRLGRRSSLRSET